MTRLFDKKANHARKTVRIALERGDLLRPDSCQLCGLSAAAYEQQSGQKTEIVAHHYLGYEPEHALDIWWICRSCNTLLSGKHDGSLTLAEAQALVLASPLTQGRLKIARSEAPQRPDPPPTPNRPELEVLKPVYQKRLF